MSDTLLWSCWYYGAGYHYRLLMPWNILSLFFYFFVFFFNDTATTEIYTLSLHDALPIYTWPYGYSMPIAVRYTQDAFSRSGWLWPVDAKGEPLKATSYMAVGFYVAKYVNKKSDMDLAAKGLGAKEWNNSLKTKLSL